MMQNVLRFHGIFPPSGGLSRSILA